MVVSSIPGLRPPHYLLVGRPITGMGHRLWAGIPPRYVTSHPGQLSFLPSVGREMTTGGDALRLGCKGRLVHSIRGRARGLQVKLCEPSFTRAILSALEVNSHGKASAIQTNVVSSTSFFVQRRITHVRFYRIYTRSLRIVPRDARDAPSCTATSCNSS